MLEWNRTKNEMKMTPELIIRECTFIWYIYECVLCIWIKRWNLMETLNVKPQKKKNMLKRIMKWAEKAANNNWMLEKLREKKIIYTEDRENELVIVIFNLPGKRKKSACGVQFQQMSTKSCPVDITKLISWQERDKDTMKTISIEMNENTEKNCSGWATMNGHCVVFFVLSLHNSLKLLYLLANFQWLLHYLIRFLAWLVMVIHTYVCIWSCYRTGWLSPYSFQRCKFIFFFYFWMMRFMSICLHTSANIHEKSNQQPSSVQSCFSTVASEQRCQLNQQSTTYFFAVQFALMPHTYIRKFSTLADTENHSHIHTLWSAYKYNGCCGTGTGSSRKWIVKKSRTKFLSFDNSLVFFLLHCWCFLVNPSVWIRYLWELSWSDWKMNRKLKSCSIRNGT